MKKLFISPAQVEGQRIILDKEESNHLIRALRYRTGDQVLVSDQQNEYLTNIESLDNDRVTLFVISVDKTPERTLTLRLVQGLCKGEKMDWVIQKAAELGVAEVIPVQTKRAVVRLEPAKASKKAQRWQKIALAAAKQSGAVAVPVIAEPVGLAEVAAGLAAGLAARDSLVLLFWEEAAPGTLKKVLQSEQKKDITICIGPEGGFDPEEVRMMEEAGAQVVSLGDQILRTETAAVAAISCVMYEKDKLG